MHPEDFPLFLAHLERLKASQTGTTLKFEYRMRHKNGDWRWFCSQDRICKGTADSLHVAGIARDITNRKQTEIALKESEESLKLATEASQIGMWFWDLAEDTLEWTQQCKAIFGLPPDAEISYEKFVDILHPEDRDRTDLAVNRALTDKIEYNIEYRAVLSDDRIRWIAAKGKGFYDQDGKPINMMGTVQDISDRKQNEIALQQSQDELKLIAEIIPQQVWTALPNGEIDYIN
ncbi:MAG: PAS domain-containing protein, partial [Pleurocapsa sp.]